MENANLIVGVQWLVCDMTQLTSFIRKAVIIDLLVMIVWMIN